MGKAVSNDYLTKRTVLTPYNIHSSFIPTNIFLNPDPIVQLAGQRSVSVYEEMMLYPGVSSPLNTRMNTIIGSKYAIAPGGPDPVDIMWAEFCRESFEKMETVSSSSFARMSGVVPLLKMILDGPQKGFSGVEAIWNLSEGRIAQVVHHVPQAFDFGGDKSPMDFQDWWTAETLWVRPSAHEAQVKAPPYKFMMFIYDSKYGNPYGNSILKCIYWPWYAVFLNGFRDRLNFVGKWASPTVVQHVPQNLLEDDTAAANFFNGADNFQHEFAARFLASPEGKPYTTLMESNRYGASQLFKDFERSMHVLITLGLLGNVLSTLESEFGTRAQAGIHENVRKDYVDADLMWVQEQFQIPIQWMCEIKFGSKTRAKDRKREISNIVTNAASLKQASQEVKKYFNSGPSYPKFVFDPPETEDLNKAIVRDSIGASLGPVPWSFMQEKYGWPTPRKLDNGQMEPLAVSPMAAGKVQFTPDAGTTNPLESKPPATNQLQPVHPDNFGKEGNVNMSDPSVQSVIRKMSEQSQDMAEMIDMFQAGQRELQELRAKGE